MAKTKNIEWYRKKLLERRNEIFAEYLQLKENQQQLSQPEIEPEEQASKWKLAEETFQLDEQEANEIGAIDWALRKIGSNGYGICESCGDPITPKRLKAIPWTPYCIQCAREMENMNQQAYSRR
jgi:DnaK suppressor protein